MTKEIEVSNVKILELESEIAKKDQVVQNDKDILKQVKDQAETDNVLKIKKL